MHALLVLLSAATIVQAPAPTAAESDIARWKRQASAVTIVRDDWGIAHIHGKTDADAVFGMIYAQAEDDFNRIETNYLNSMGRLAEAEGEGAIWQDLRMRLFIDPDKMKAKYAASPAWLKKLMNAWADGLNYYLPCQSQGEAAGHHPVRAVDGAHLQRGEHRRRHRERGPRPAPGVLRRQREPASAAAGRTRSSSSRRGSNGFAIAPKNTVNGRALLLINPHTSFFFRSELQMTSDEGLNAYGAVTWGQFFLYQGFNDRRRLDAHVHRGGRDRRVRGEGDAERRRLSSTGQQRCAASNTTAVSQPGGRYARRASPFHTAPRPG